MDHDDWSADDLSRVARDLLDQNKQTLKSQEEGSTDHAE